METAGEGGPYGMALFAAYMLRKKCGLTLEDFLDEEVFSGVESSTVTADEKDVEGFSTFLSRYKKALPFERTAIEVL